MIHYHKEKQLFQLQTKQSSYLFEVNKFKHLQHIYYGGLIDLVEDASPFKMKYEFELGSATSYEEKGYMPQTTLFEVGTYGKGDYREPSIHIEFSDGSRTADFLYQSHDIIDNYNVKGMPMFQKDSTLKVVLKDQVFDVYLVLYYSVLYEEDVILRNLEIINDTDGEIILDKALSCNIDMLNKQYELTKLDGAWIRERHISHHFLTKGIVKLDSKKGVSSSDHNPFVMIKEKHTTEERGNAYGFALVYSGNFEANIEVSPHNLLRVNMGVNSFDFRFNLEKGASFTAPEVVLTFSSNGMNQLSSNFHNAVNKNLVSNQKERPILVNNWEATYFDFKQKKLLAIAKKAKKLGVELFCLDDGWFSRRDDDLSSLGDWHYNKKKLPRGLNGLAKKINKIGLEFGIWVEPEMVNEDSDLYRLHPDWAIQLPGRKPSLGRNQLILDLTNKQVLEHLKKTLHDLFSSAHITYVKWDMNRNFSDVYGSSLSIKNQGKFNHLYVLGLYELLAYLKETFPHVLFESCSSGGNRYDLGMLYYMPQTWTSDNTDAYERLFIQEGTSLLYPLSTISNHVSGDTSHQVFRHTPLETRFNVAAFGVLGYELDMSILSRFERKLIEKQIAFYKEHRNILTYGTLKRIRSVYHDQYTSWAVVNEDKSKAILGVFQGLIIPNAPFEKIKIDFLDDDKMYIIKAREQYMNIKVFGSLISHLVSFLKPNTMLHTFLSNRYTLKLNDFEKKMSGKELRNMDLLLEHNFTGTGYEPGGRVMLMEDFGSRIFVIKEISNEQENKMDI